MAGMVSAPVLQHFEKRQSASQTRQFSEKLFFKIDYYYVSTLSLKHSRLDNFKEMSLGVQSSKFSLFSLLTDFLIDAKL